MANELNFKGTRCEIELDSYAKDGSTAIRLIDTADGMPYSTATVWIEGLEKGEVAIKNYSENEGMYYALLEAGVIEPEHRTVLSGFATVPICRLKQSAFSERIETKSFEAATREATCGGCDPDTDICTCHYEWSCPGCGKKVEAVGEALPDYAAHSEGGHCVACQFGLHN